MAFNKKFIDVCKIKNYIIEYLSTQSTQPLPKSDPTRVLASSCTAETLLGFGSYSFSVSRDLYVIPSYTNIFLFKLGYPHAKFQNNPNFFLQI